MIADESTFAYRFAYCLDWMQWGNESFAGGGSQYKFRDTDLSCEPSYGTKFSELGSCRAEAASLMVDWMTDQMWSALEGSALAGRPLRMVTPALTAGSVLHAWENQSGFTAGLIDGLCEWANRNQMYLDVHVYYFQVTEAEQVIGKLTGTGYSPPWTTPDWRIALEWGPKADFEGDVWWEDVTWEPRTNFEVHNQFFFEGLGDPEPDWEEFVEEWIEESESFGGTQPNPGLRFDDVLGWMNSAGFNAAAYGPTLQFQTGTPQAPYRFNIGALRATRVRQGFVNTPGLFTPVFMLLYEEQGAPAPNYEIVPFEPHNEPCDSSETCPDCE